MYMYICIYLYAYTYMYWYQRLLLVQKESVLTVGSPSYDLGAPDEGVRLRPDNVRIQGSNFNKFQEH